MNDVIAGIIHICALVSVFALGYGFGKNNGYKEGSDVSSATRQMYLESIVEYNDARGRYNARLDTLIEKYEKELYKDGGNKNDAE